MADPSGFKLFRTVDPTTVNVPLKEKFANLTLSSNKKKQQQQQSAKQDQLQSVSRQLLPELDIITVVQSDEHPLLRSDSSSLSAMGRQQSSKASRDDVSDYMETLQLSADGCTQRTVDADADADVERLSTQVYNLTVKPEIPQISICISSTTEEDLDDDDDDDDNDNDKSCITISDTSDSECAPAEEQPANHQEPETEPGMTVSGQVATTAAPEPQAVHLSNGKVQRIEAFLRDVSFERRAMIRRGQMALSGDHTRLASADTESMSLLDVDCTQLPSDMATITTTHTSEPNEQLNNSKRLADNDTEMNTLCSSEEQLETDSSKRLAHDDTEVNTPDMDEPMSDSTHLDQTIPETSTELEPSPARPSSSSSAETETEAVIQVSSINISAKINIKIHIPKMDSSSAESDDAIDEEAKADVSYVKPQNQALERQKSQRRTQEQKSSIFGDDGSEDEQFLTNAEKLLNELYGTTWQTPENIYLLKHPNASKGKTAATTTKTTASTSSSTGINRTPLNEIRRQPRVRRQAATTAKKGMPPPPPPPATPNESALGDFSLFKQALHSTKLNSTHLPKVARTERRPVKQVVRTNHIHEERLRALVDTDSGGDASDDEDADATASDSSDNANGNANDGNLTYLDLTKAEVEVVGNPNEEADAAISKFPKRLDDILRTCRATDKPKLPATPATPATPAMTADRIPTRRQLFTPNTGFETEEEAKRIVDQALDLSFLDDLANFYLPDTAVHRRMLEVKKQLGMPIKTPRRKPIFKLHTPQTAPPAKTKTVERSKMPQNNVKQGKDVDKRSGKCSFIKSLEPEISRDRCDNEAFFYRENYAKNKEQLAMRLYDMFNAQVCNNGLQVPITWSKLLRNTAGRCTTKQRGQQRSSSVELSSKVLTSADRLRCTLIHELCHAAAWVFDGACGHGVVWKRWTGLANDKFPDLPPIRVCHDYDIEFKYTYKCDNCNAASYAHSRSRKVENLRCSICCGHVIVLLNRKDKSGNIVPTPVREATGFAKFVKENFHKYKRPNLTAPQVMRILSAEYAKVKPKGQLAKKDEVATIVSQVETLTLDDDDDEQD
ncbi:uncharacterized protein LOC6569447 [Drosophila grimshawi]|uniref:GH17850 n=1 Tax=Drosophila grimshawi TaxID=7222 RepID=B4JWZ0_DROGR|nr:uncharacterized protein LOC6569447 [Drosophila grimshawi]EDV95266.1 GH17850 [Drosophila grimshawi]